MKKLSLRTWALAAAAAVWLTACGGGGGGDGGGNSGIGPGAVVAGTDVPVGVEQSINDVIAFARLLIAGTSETSDPVVLGNARVATSESDDPADL